MDCFRVDCHLLERARNQYTPHYVSSYTCLYKIYQNAPSEKKRGAKMRATDGGQHVVISLMDGLVYARIFVLIVTVN